MAKIFLEGYDRNSPLHVKRNVLKVRASSQGQYERPDRTKMLILWKNWSSDGGSGLQI